MVGLTGQGGLPDHRALHPRWETHHRPVAARFHTATVAIRRHSNATGFDPDTGQSTFAAPVQVWTGAARVQRTGTQSDETVGDRQVVTRNATVSIPVDTPEVHIGDEVQITSYRDLDSGDPHLTNVPLWIRDIRPGSLLFQRDLVVLDTPPVNR